MSSQHILQLGVVSWYIFWYIWYILAQDLGAGPPRDQTEVLTEHPDHDNSSGRVSVP